MKKLLKKIGIDWDEPSTKKGLALVGAGVALAAGHPEIITARVTAEGVQYGGLIGTSIPLLVGVWETFRKEFRSEG
ncbi:hypothetical protein [Vibrio fluvialis]|uniref:hypothetical protein n=1 Tax=Vibrio fluvialis TaxID=676 RepID=UPI003D7C8E0C